MISTASTSTARTGRLALLGALTLAGALTMALGGCGRAEQPVGKPDANGLIPINVAGSEAISSASPLFVAIEQGYFKEAGLDVRYVSFSSGAMAMAAAMKTGDVDIGLGSATQWISDTARGAIEGKLVGEFTDNNYVILGGNGITNVRQLKGKTFAISSPNAGDHLYSQAVLSHYGIDPASVTWLQIGEPSARLTALFAGRIDATEMPLTSLPPEAVNRVLVRADESPVPFVSNAIYVRQPLLDANRDAVARFLAAVGKGADWIRANPEKAIPACRKTGSSEKACRVTIATALASTNPYTWSHTTRINVDGVKAMIPVIATAVPQAQSLSIDKIVDVTLTPAQ